MPSSTRLVRGLEAHGDSEEPDEAAVTLAHGQSFWDGVAGLGGWATRSAGTMHFFNLEPHFDFAHLVRDLG